MAITMQISLPGFTTKAQQKFNKRSGQLVAALNQRMRKKGFSGNLPLKKGREILASGVGQPCKFCGERIKISTMSPDHPMPIARGGDPWTMECICISCQREKGELTAEEFAQFLADVRKYSPEAQADIHQRMRAGGAFAKMQFAMRRMMASKDKMREALPGQV
jgi:hypothetical protein